MAAPSIPVRELPAKAFRRKSASALQHPHFRPISSRHLKFKLLEKKKKEEDPQTIEGNPFQCKSTIFKNFSTTLLPKMPPIKPQNPLQLPTLKCTLGCPILDRLLDGGIPTNSITELVSEAGCGKTQLSLQLLLCAQLPPSRGGLSASSLYIHTEFPFPFRRLHQLSLSFRSPDDSSDPCDRIFVHAAHSADDLLALLDRVDALLSNLHSPLPPVKLIVIDSIAALFRSEFENCPSDLKRRSSLFFRIAGKLKAQAERFGLAVVVTNQVMDLVGEDGVNGLKVGNFLELYSSGRRVCPALGLSWANCVNSRVFLSRSDEVWNVGSGSENQEELGGRVRTRRRMQVVFAPHLPESSCEFVIVREGVFGVG